MTNPIRHFSRRHPSKYRRKLLYYMLIPIIPTVIFFLSVCRILIQRESRRLNEQYREALDFTVQSYDREMRELSRSSLLLLNSDSFQEIMFGTEPIDEEDRWKLTDCSELLHTYVDAKDILCRAGFFVEREDSFLSSSGIMSRTEFESSDIYERETDYDDTAEDPTLSGTSVLSDNSVSSGTSVQSGLSESSGTSELSEDSEPSGLHLAGADVLPDKDGSEDGAGRKVLTFLQYRLGTRRIPVPLYLWVDREECAKLLRKELPTANSAVFLIRNEDSSVLASTAPDLEASLADYLSGQDFIKTSSTGTGEQDGWNAKMLSLASENRSAVYLGFSGVLTDSGLSSEDDLSLLLLVPRKDFRRMTMSAYLLCMIIFVLCCITGFFFSCLVSRRVYAPISALVRSLEQHTPAEGQIDDELSFLTEHISSLLDSREVMEETLTTALPTLHSRYLLNIFYQEEYDNLQLEPIIRRYPFHFPWESFTCALLHTKLEDRYYENLSQEERLLAHQSFIDMLKEEPAEGCTKYVFRLDGSNYCIIYNTFSDDVKELIELDFQALLKRFTIDNDSVRLYLTAGTTVSSLQSLRDSYRKARITMSELSLQKESACLFYRTSDAPAAHYTLEYSKESQLLTSLIQGDEEAALSVTAELISANQKAGITESNLGELYADLYQIGKKASERIRLDYAAALGEDYIPLPEFLGNLNNLQRSDYLTRFYQTICRNQPARTSTHIDGAELKKYIDTHFTEDLYLELLADQYGTSPKYMSRILKNALGIPFKQYLNTLRITHAKELLSESDLKIEEIALRSGFNGRNTFIRLFKALEGMTPSEYRKLSASPR